MIQANKDGATSAPLGLLSVGLAALFSTLMIYSCAAITFLRLPGLASRMGTFAETLLLASAVAAAIGLILSLRGRIARFATLGIVSSIGYLCCSLAIGFAGYFAIDSVTVYVALGTATALFDVGLVLLWGRVCAKLLTIRRALMVLSAASILSAGVFSAYRLLPPEGFLALFFVCSTVAAVVPLALQNAEGAAEELPERETQGAGEERAASHRHRLSSLFDVIGLPSLGLVAFAFVMAVMRTEFGERQLSYFAMLVVAAIAVLVYAGLNSGRRLLSGELQLAVLPVLATMLLATIAITASLQMGEEVVVLLTYATYGLAAILTLSTLCAVAHAGEFPSDLLFAVALLVFCTTSLLGQGTANLLSDDRIGVAVTVVTAVYAFALALVSHVRQRAEARLVGGDGIDAADSSGDAAGEGFSLQGRAGPKEEPFAASLEDRCRALAEEHGLTAREREILLYLAEGHNGAYIASVLYISPNTARTHIHNIYRKLDVSSREEVLSLTRG